MTWQTLLKDELQAPYFQELTAKVASARSSTTVYPAKNREIHFVNSAKRFSRTLSKKLQSGKGKTK